MAAVRSVYASEDEDWKLTAVFCMQYIKGFEAEIVEALESPNPDIHYVAVCAAGTLELDAAWQHVVGVVESGDDDDEDISEAVVDALGMAEGRMASEFDDDGDDFFDDFDEDDEDSEDGYKPDRVIH